tara:strand:+ start:1195 stop:1728 length:534 start_codon:yes stop_codon:yes gene_type:complete
MSKIKMQNVRLSFPSLYRKAVFGGDETKFEGTFLLDKTTHADVIKKIEAGIKAINADKHKGKALASDKVCLKDGDTIDYDGYAGNMSIKASSTKRPMVLGADKAPLTEDDGKPYAGCYVNAIVELWGQKNQFGERVNANLLAVQFAKDGEPFGDGVTASVDDFDEIIIEDADMDDFI